MPREKQFDHEEALTRAMEAFWAKGYEATSLQDLVDCMGINRGSLYATYGDKRRLFVQTLRHYDAKHRASWLAGVAEANGPRAAVLAPFDQVVAEALGEKPCKGCFLVNTALELSPHDVEIADLVATGLAGTEAFFCAMMKKGQAAGEISADLPAEEKARALLGLLAGLRVMSRSRPEPALLKAIAGQAAALLD